MSSSKTTYLIVFCTLLFAPIINQAKTYYVANKTDLNSAVSVALPGDSIMIKDQVWAGIDFILTCNGTENQVITICPETPGGASLESGSRIEIGGDYLVVSGFKVTNGSNSNNAVVFSSNGDYAYYSRLTNCLIDNWGPSNSTSKIHWVVVSGGYNRIDHCQFSNMTHPGVTLMVNAGADQTGHHQIDHNLFGSKPGGNGNGYESIKMGGGDYSMYPLYTVVEKNYFTRCDGEVELISNKSWENIYRYNTFYECKGTITLRWGRKCIVDGNYFIGNGIDDTGGIRITDQDHLIVNNYFENLTGKNARAAISIMSGIPDTEGGDSGHGQTKNARILHNTIINCKQSINIGYYDKDDKGDPRGDITAPENCIIANNIIWSKHAPLIEEDWAPSINTQWFTNIAFGAALGLEPDSGIIFKDPLIEPSVSGIYKISDNSPALNAGTIFSDVALYDFEKQKRSDGLPDIGADELSGNLSGNIPVGPEDVGPDWQKLTALKETHQLTNAVLIFPNPANQRFYIQLDKNLRGRDVKVEILDMTGRLKHSKVIFNTQTNQEIVVNGLKGPHLVRIICASKIFNSKIIFNL